MPKYATGVARAKAAARTAGNRPDFFSLKVGEVFYGRLITDPDMLRTAQVHINLPTKAAPKGTAADKWPSHMGGVCQNDEAFVDHYDTTDGSDPETAPESVKVAVYEDGYGTCYGCNAPQFAALKGKYGKPANATRAQTFGLFAERQPIRADGQSAGPDDRPVGFRNVMAEAAGKDGKPHRLPKIVIASQSWSNFWSALITAAYMAGDPRFVDFRIERTAEAEYAFSPSPANPEHAPGTPSWKEYDDALEVRDLSVDGVLTQQSTPEYWGRLFDPEWKDADSEGSDDSGSGAGQVAAEITDEEAAAARDRVMASFKTSPS